MSVINPFCKNTSQSFCNPVILLFSKVAQIHTLSMRRKPLSRNCND